MNNIEKIKTIDGFLFDKDGTLIDYYKSWMPRNTRIANDAARGDAQLSAQLLKIGGFCSSSDTVKGGSALAAGTAVEIAQCWHEYLPKGSWNLDELSTHINYCFSDCVEQYSVAVCNLPEFCRALHKLNKITGMATADSEKNAIKTINHFEIAPFFDFVCGYDSGFKPKPDPEMIFGFCKTTGLTPDKIAMVGDNYHDLEMGERAGCGINIGVLTGTSTREELEEYADIVLDDVTGILPLIQQ